jgi:hypothetical protein
MPRGKIVQSIYHYSRNSHPVQDEMVGICVSHEILEQDYTAIFDANMSGHTNSIL